MEILPLELSRYEIELALYALATLPYEQSGAVIENIKAQLAELED